jgi:hypothetical protein
MRRSRGFLSLAVMAFVGACKAAPPPSPPPAAEPPAPPPAPLSVVGVDLGKSVGPDMRVASPMTTFGPRDTIYAAVSTAGTATAATLTAVWSFQSGQRVDSTSRSVAPTGPAVTEFHISKPSPWPVGKYKVAIWLDGALATEKEFEVRR